MGTFSLIRGNALRATRLNGCGDPVLGPDSVVETDGFISVGLTANQEQGEAISQTNAAGRVCILDEPAPKFVNYSIEVQFCGVNPELLALMTGMPVRLNAAGTEVVGFTVNSKVQVSKTGFALELWSKVSQEECDASGLEAFGYLLLPFIKGGTLGDFSVENGAVNFTMTGARTKDGSGWGAGPFDVVRDETDAAGPLNDPVTVGDHLIMEVTTVPPPDVEDEPGDAQALGVPATNANVTSANPAALTPANSYAPKDLDEAQDGASGEHGVNFTATPTSAWTAGKYVVLRDGSTAHWSGTAWTAGPA